MTIPLFDDKPPFQTDEIDSAFELLTTRDGRTVGGSVSLTDLDAGWLHDLEHAELIEPGRGTSRFTRKGLAMQDLIDDYAGLPPLWGVRLARVFDPEKWNGDLAELEGLEARLASDEVLSQRTFDSSREAFAAGLALGSRRHWIPSGLRRL